MGGRRRRGVAKAVRSAYRYAAPHVDGRSRARSGLLPGAGVALRNGPGFAVGALTLPLNVPDPYLHLTLQQPNSASLVDTFGVLSSQGTATAWLNVPPGAQFPSLVGLTFHHAYGVFGADLVVAQVSNAIELKLLP